MAAKSKERGPRRGAGREIGESGLVVLRGRGDGGRHCVRKRGQSVQEVSLQYLKISHCEVNDELRKRDEVSEIEEP